MKTEAKITLHYIFGLFKIKRRIYLYCNFQLTVKFDSVSNKKKEKMNKKGLKRKRRKRFEFFRMSS